MKWMLSIVVYRLALVTYPQGQAQYLGLLSMLCLKIDVLLTTTICTPQLNSSICKISYCPQPAICEVCCLLSMWPPRKPPSTWQKQFLNILVICHSFYIVPFLGKKWPEEGNPLVTIFRDSTEMVSSGQRMLIQLTSSLIFCTCSFGGDPILPRLTVLKGKFTLLVL